MSMMKRTDGIEISFPMSSGTVQAETYACSHCGHSVALPTNKRSQLIGIFRKAVLENRYMVNSSFDQSDVLVADGDELYPKITQELYNVISQISLEKFGNSWYPGIETMVFEEVFDVENRGFQLQIKDTALKSRVKILAQSIGGWWANPKYWTNLTQEHPGFVTIIQWFQMYSNRAFWFKNA